MDNLEILIKAILSLKDVEDSKKQIASELPKLESQLQSDEKARIKIVAGLDVQKSRDLIQSQLTTLTSQAKIPTIKVGIDTKNNNVSDKIKNTQKEIEQTVSKVDVTDKIVAQFNKSFNIVGKAAKEIKEELKILFADFADAFNTAEAERYYEALEKIYILTNKYTKDFSNVDKKNIISDLKTELNPDGSKVFIDSKLKAELDDICDKGQDVKAVLNTVFGGGKWAYDKTKGGVSFDSLVSKELVDRCGGLAEAIVHIYNNIKNIQDTNFNVFSGFDCNEAKQNIEYYLQNILKLGSEIEEVETDVNNLNKKISNTTSNIEEETKVINEQIKATKDLKAVRESITYNSFDNTDTAITEAEEKYRNLFGVNDSAVSGTWTKNSEGNIDGFIIKVRKAQGEIESFQYTLKEVADDMQFIYTGGEGSDDGVHKRIANINKTYSKYSQKFAQFKSTNHEILSGLSKPIDNFNKKLEGLKTGETQIYEVENAFRELNIEASKITQNFSKQLSPIDSAIRNLAKGEDTIAGLKAEITGLNNVPKEVNDEISAISKSLKKVNDIEKKFGRNEDWAKAYREWDDSVKSLTSKIQLLKKEQANLASTQVFKIDDLKADNIPYMTKVYNTVEKQMERIQRLAKSQNWELIDVHGVEDVTGKVKQLELTIKDVDGALKKVIMQREKLQGNGKAQYGFVQSGDVKVIETAEKAQQRLQEQIDKTHRKYTDLFNTLSKNINTDIWKSTGETGIVNEINEFNSALQGLKNGTHTVEQVEIAFVNLEEKVKNIETTIASDSSLKQTISNYNNLVNVLDETSQRLDKLKSNQAVNSSVNIDDLTSQLDNAKTKLKELQQLEARLGKNGKWAEQYHLVNNEIQILLSSLKLAEQTSKSDISTENKLRLEYMRQINKEYAALISLKNKFANSDNEDNKNVYQTEISQTEEVIRNLIEQLQIGGLITQTCQEQINALERQVALTDKINANNARNKEITESTQALENHFKVIDKTTKDIENTISSLSGFNNSTVFKKNASDSQVTQTKQEITNLIAEYQKLLTQLQSNPSSKGLDILQSELTELNNRMKVTIKSAKDLEDQLKNDNSATAFSQKVSLLTKQIQTYQSVNTKASKKYKNNFSQLLSNLSDPNIDDEALKAIKNDFNSLKQEIATAGETGKTFFETIKNSAAKFGSWMSLTQTISQFANEITDAITELKEIDTILTEISKTSDLTTESLDRLGRTSFSVASKYGKKASDYLVGVQEMYRAGFNNAAEMSELSILAQAAGDMESDSANNYLMATNAAYEYKGSVEKLNKVLDSQNFITNNAAVSMQDMADATFEAASIASQYGVEVDELSALIAVAVSKTRESGAEVGTALKALFVNLQDTTSNPIKSAFDAVGISMTKMVDGSEQLKTPIELIKELSVAFNSLPEGDIRRANILNDIGGKHHANTLSSILSDLDSYYQMLEYYSQGQGSAMNEAMKTAESWEGKLNKMYNTLTDLVNGVIDSNTAKFVIDFLTSVIEKLDRFIDNIGVIPTILSSIASIKTFKNAGRTNKTCPFSIQPQNICIEIVTRFKIRLSNCWDDYAKAL